MVEVARYGELLRSLSIIIKLDGRQQALYCFDFAPSIVSRGKEHWTGNVDTRWLATASSARFVKHITKLGEPIQ